MNIRFRIRPTMQLALHADVERHAKKLAAVKQLMIPSTSKSKFNVKTRSQVNV